MRALINDQGEQVRKRRPSMPVEVLGLHGALGWRATRSPWSRTRPAPAKSPTTASA